MTIASPNRQILLVDDDHEALTKLASQLGADGFDVSVAHDGVEALRGLESRWPDLVVTALRLPQMDGVTLARLIKERADLPIIVLSAISSGDRKAEAIEAVAEDYITKPFHYPELRARINRVLLRMGDQPFAGMVRLGPDLTLELHRGRATVAGQPVALTPFESRLLYVLGGRLGTVVPTSVLLTRGWAEAENPDPSYVWATMRRLRQKLERDPDNPIHVETIRGVGYRLNQVPEDA